MAKKPSGKPFPRLTEHKLTCIYCFNTQDLQKIIQVSKKYKNEYRFNYSCDSCQMSLQVYKSRNGMLSVQNNSSRLRKNIELGINRIKINDIFQNGNSLNNKTMENKKWHVGQEVWDKTVSEEAGDIIDVKEDCLDPVRVKFKDCIRCYDLNGKLEFNIVPTLSTTPYEIIMEGFSQEVEEELPYKGQVCWGRREIKWQIGHFIKKNDKGKYEISANPDDEDGIAFYEITTKNPYEVEEVDFEPKIGDIVYVWDKNEPVTVLSGILHDILDSKFKIKSTSNFTYKHCSLKNPLIK